MLIAVDIYTQLSLFGDENIRVKKEFLEKSIDAVRCRFGHYAVQKALQLMDKKLNASPIEENIIFPVSFLDRKENYLA